MKLTLYKQIDLFVMLVFLLNQAFAQTQNELLLPYLPQDSIASKTPADNLTAPYVPLQQNVRQNVNQYLNENSETLANIKAKKTTELKTIQQILTRHGIPAGLKYLAVVESELKNNATSRSGAAGIWQLMPETARTFGLQVNAKTDQRRYISQSSVAVACYLKELYKQFDDWLLVVAAYNCGSGKVYKAIKLSGSREFWKLQRFLPGETSAHVKHFIATHYYYEQNGSVVTLTKKERLRYLVSLAEMMAKKEQAKQADTNISTIQPINCALVGEQEGEAVVEWNK